MGKTKNYSKRREEFLLKCAEIALATDRIDSWLSFQTPGDGRLSFCVGNISGGHAHPVSQDDINTIDQIGAKALDLAAEYVGVISPSSLLGRDTKEMRIFIDTWETYKSIQKGRDNTKP